MNNASENNPFKQREEKKDEWPEEVMLRFKMQAERTGESVEKVIDAYIKHIADTWNCTDWTAEDADLLVDWAEGMYIEDRSSNISGGGGDTVTFVGHWMGVEEKSADRNGWSVRNARQKWQEDPNAAMSDGVVGHYYEEDGVWVINTANGALVTTDPANADPTMGFKQGADWICLLSKAGRPYPYERMGRYYRFFGNEPKKFLDGDLRFWRVDLTNENRNMKVDVGRPVSIQVRLPNTKSEAFQDVLSTNYNFGETMKYTDEWCPEHIRHHLQPFKMWTNDDYMGDAYVNLTELEDAYNAGKRHFTGRDGNDGTVGPDVIVRGSVMRMSTEGKPSEWDETGRNFSLSVSSLNLQNQHGKGRMSEIPCWISGSCNDIVSPFHFRDIDDELWGYGEKSSVLVYGRLKMKVQDGQSMPQLSVYGVYTNPSRAIRRVGGGDTDSSQFE